MHVGKEGQRREHAEGEKDMDMAVAWQHVIELLYGNIELLA